jgi:hypothetical protein
MPRPIYIIAATKTSEDKFSGLLSLFEIIEVLDVQLIPPKGGEDLAVIQAHNKGRMAAAESTVIAVWMREEGDEDKVFEHQFALIFPDREQALSAVPFQFSPDAQLQRFMMKLQGFPVPPESTVIEVESRIRVQDSATWNKNTQRYPLICRVHHMDTASTP